MDDITQKITSILNDPESLDTIRSIADSLMSDNAAASGHKDPDRGFDFSQLLGGLSPDQLGGIMRIANAFNNGNDNRTSLLLALKPHLSLRRQNKVDQAVKLLKIASVMPLLSESGLFKL